MRLTRVVCRTFRRLADVDFAPMPGVNVVSGENAQGKTSLLEAVLYAATTKSHRTAQETELAAHGGEGFHLRVEAERGERPVEIEVNWWRGEKRFKINGVPQTRLSDILGRVNVVLFVPDDAALVKGAASVRRRFLDMELSQISPPYLAALQQYRQALRQRNELLRAASPAEDMIDLWDVQLARHGQVLSATRAAFVEELSALAGPLYARIADGEPMAAAYEPDVKPNDDIAAALARCRAADLRQRVTTRGPHRDDLEISIDGQPARSFGSQGQQKTAVLAMKLAEVELVRGRTGEVPLLMLDEVLAELDPQRARRLFESIPADTQVLATTTRPELPAGVAGPDPALFRIHGGILERA